MEKRTQLELKDTAAYLPYELKCLLNDGRVIELTMLDTLHIPGKFEFKPILKRLSDLTDKQWLEVFAVGLNEANPPLTDEYIKAERFIERHDHHMIEVIVNDKGWKDSLSFEVMGLQFTSGGIRFNQKAAFEKLYSFHADIDGLIDAGLAVDINTINP